MSSVDVVNLVLLIFRLSIGSVFALHGWNHVFGGGKIAGTGRWFESLGMRPGRLHAWVASITELGGGALLVAGLLTPLAAAAVLGTMTVAFVTTHMRNGFFIFQPGEGYEYVLVLGMCAVLFGGVGPGEWSIDYALGVFGVGWPSLLVAVVIGLAGGAMQLVLFWRPGRVALEHRATGADDGGGAG